MISKFRKIYNRIILEQMFDGNILYALTYNMKQLYEKKFSFETLHRKDFGPIVLQNGLPKDIMNYLIQQYNNSIGKEIKLYKPRYDLIKSVVISVNFPNITLQNTYKFHYPDEFGRKTYTKKETIPFVKAMTEQCAANFDKLAQPYVAKLQAVLNQENIQRQKDKARLKSEKNIPVSEEECNNFRKLMQSKFGIPGNWGYKKRTEAINFLAKQPGNLVYSYYKYLNRIYNYEDASQPYAEIRIAQYNHDYYYDLGELIDKIKELFI